MYTKFTHLKYDLEIESKSLLNFYIFQVRVDGVIMDLPYKSSEFAVFADADSVIVEGHGFQVKADKNVNNVDIDLSGWYFGKTGGLLGTLNHERYDDMIMPNKQITSDAFTLGSAWQVQERCR
jgi:hypothetical protein